ncbi:hypothetical protein L6452_18136 [Arctium lappa]|uniref:Uncharacterized protein n=1 Tax=Arctium lappa TaxID=4217 RepID=A0ACB9C5E4_ARCLA|nr:hypothetical protein L6452_18136 [Arctium lappa]
MVHGGYHHQTGCNMGSALYPTRLFSGASTPVPPPQLPLPPHPHLFTSSPSRISIPYSSLHHKSQSEKDYFMGHVCSSNVPQFIVQNLSCTATPPLDGSSDYTCIGAPVGQSFTGKSGGESLPFSYLAFWGIFESPNGTREWGSREIRRILLAFLFSRLLGFGNGVGQPSF